MPLTLPLRLHRLATPAALAAALLPVATATLLATSPAQAQTAVEADLARRLDLLAAEVQRLQAQLHEVQQQQAARPAAAAQATAHASAHATAPASAQASAQAPAQATAPAAAPASSSAPAPTSAQPNTVLSSYGEINYNRPRKASQNSQADLRRFVLGFQHRIDEQTRVVAELEVEHAVTSATDAGEVALEQAYVEHQITPTWALRAGLFLMPMGLLNENHEPPAFFGVERNVVETAIIPSTWREGGVQAIGQFDNGLTLQAGVSTGFNLNKWDATSSEAAEAPLRSIHQELALAKARSLALFGALNWRAVPGLLVGAGLFSGGAGHGQTAAPARVTLWDVHARWTPGRWDLSALYSRGAISNTAALNTRLVGSASLIPASFDGGYLQAGYAVWQQGRYKLTPFARWERVNTARSYADLGPGLTPAARPGQRVATLGANFDLAPGIVLKADVQRVQHNPDADRSSVGLGWSF